jgi:hypothetical protein
VVQTTSEIPPPLGSTIWLEVQQSLVPVGHVAAVDGLQLFPTPRMKNKLKVRELWQHHAWLESERPQALTALASRSSAGAAMTMEARATVVRRFFTSMMKALLQGGSSKLVLSRVFVNVIWSGSLGCNGRIIAFL